MSTEHLPRFQPNYHGPTGTEKLGIFTLLSKWGALLVMAEINLSPNFVAPGYIFSLPTARHGVVA